MSDSNKGHLLAVAVGAGRTRVGVFHGDELSDPVSLPNGDVPALVAAVLKAAEGEHGVSIVIADVNPKLGDAIQKAVEDAGEENVYRIGRDLQIPMEHSLDDAAGVGNDRLLCAYGAFTRAKQACVVVTLGVHITVDFVDGEGVFHGGVVAPGAELMVTSLGGTVVPSLKSAAMPRDGSLQAVPAPPRTKPSISDEEVEQSPAAGFSRPRPFGRDIQHSRELGAANAIRGLVRHTVEEFAQFYGSFPQVVATGAEAATLFGEDSDGLVETIVPDLELIGILEVCKAVEEMRASGFE